MRWFYYIPIIGFTLGLKYFRTLEEYIYMVSYHIITGSAVLGFLIYLLIK